MDQVTSREISRDVQTLKIYQEDDYQLLSH